ncbi:MAG TPA: hypothetical protein VHO47_04505 [Candidatus Babeliales bacterium]|nr:hypothetical protein [Candidatus Babeliales bacterium]
MKIHYVVLIACCFFSSKNYTASRASHSLSERPVMYFPVPLYNENEQREIIEHIDDQMVQKPKPNWLRHLLCIIANIGRAILERENKDQMHLHVGNIFNNVASLAHEFSTRSLSAHDRKKAIEQLIEQIEDLAQTLPEPVVVCGKKNIVCIQR